MSRREWILVLIIGGLSAVFGLDQLVAQPLWARYQSLSARADQLDDQLRTARVLIDNRMIIRQRWQSYVAAGLDDEESAQRLEVQRELTGWARQAGLDLATLTSGRTSERERFHEVQFILRGSGPLQSIVSFLHEIRRSPFPLRINSCDISGHSDGGDALSLRATLSTIRLRQDGPFADFLTTGKTR